MNNVLIFMALVVAILALLMGFLVAILALIKM